MAAESLAKAALTPTTTFDEPDVLAAKALAPIAILLEPVSFDFNVLWPIDVFRAPLVFAARADTPNAVLVSTKLLPLPNVKGPINTCLSSSTC